MKVTIFVELTCATGKEHRAVLRGAAEALTNAPASIQLSTPDKGVSVSFNMKDEAQYTAVKRIDFAYRYAMPNMADSSIRFEPKQKRRGARASRFTGQCA